MKVGPAKHTLGGITKYGFYSNGNIAIQIMNEETGGLELVATVNLEPYGAPEINENQVWLKGWSENEGVPEALENAGVCKRTGQIHMTGFVFAELATLSDEALKEIEAIKP